MVDRDRACNCLPGKTVDFREKSSKTVFHCYLDYLFFNSLRGLESGQMIF